jgi:hypothetical protein
MTQALIIDQEFRDLIPPPSAQEIENLEESLIREGCREPILIWDQTIIDGHHRYEICSRLGIPFETRIMCFPSREDVISWICLNQLSRRNLSEEAYRYLIGKRYDAEKVMNQRKNESGSNQYSGPAVSETEVIGTPQEKRRKKEQNRTSVRLGTEYRIDHSTIESYGRFSRALDEVERKAPGFRRDVLSGAIRISKTKVDQMAEMPEEDVQELSERLHIQMRQSERVSLHESARIIERVTNPQPAAPEDPVIVTGIKQMPEFDPDAEINGLLLTVPTWIMAMQRLIDGTDFHQASEQARNKLVTTLRELESATSRLQCKAGKRDNEH